MKKTTNLSSVRILLLTGLMFIVSHAHALDITWDDATKTMTFSSASSEAVTLANVNASADNSTFETNIQETVCVVFEENISAVDKAVFDRPDLREEGINKLVINSETVASKAYTQSANFRVTFPKVRSIEFGVNVTKVGDNFYNYGYATDPNKLDTSPLEEVIFKGAIEDIGKYAFATAGFETIFIPNTVKYIRQGAYSNCRHAKHIVFEEESQLEVIENAGFAYLWGIEDEVISLPASLKSLHSYGFRETGYRPADSNIVGGKLEPVSTGYPKTVYVNNQALAYPEKKYVYSGPNDSNGGSGSFLYMFPNMETIIFGEDVTKIGDCLFRVSQGDYSKYNPQLKNIIFAGGIDNVDYIGGNAFNCTSLEEIHIPAGVTSIPTYAFANSKGNQVDPVKIIFDGDKVTSIGSNAFSYCNYESIELPASVTSIAAYAFSNNSNLKEIKIDAVTPPSLANVDVFKGVSYFVLRVPDESVAAYRTADVWKDLGDKCIIRAMNYVELRDGETFDRENYPPGLKTEISYTRHFDVVAGRKNWHSIYLPIALQYDEWIQLGNMYKIKNVREYDNDNNGTIDAWAVEVRKMAEGDRTKPNTPYLFRPFKSGEQAFDAVYTTLASSDPIADEDSKSWCASTDYLFVFNGNYEQSSTFAMDKYFAVTASGVLKYAGKPTTLNSYRWYMGIYDKETDAFVKPSTFYPEAVATPQSIYIIDEEDPEDATFISGIVSQGDDQTTAYYDLLGRKVSSQSLQKGNLYMYGGKKFICQ